MTKASFKTHAHIKSIIGKDLITDDNIAILELVKNSFDAGSSKVDLIFKNILSNDDNTLIDFATKRSSKLIIRDFGIGMTEDDIINKWLNIAYSEKKEKKEDFGRMLAGNKGVGRFSCDRLGRFFKMYTKVEGEAYKKLFIDWKLFEKEGDINFNIQDVEFEIETISIDDFESHTGYPGFVSGTILEIIFLREKWDTNKIISLKRQLERLINPNQAFKSNSFTISIQAEEFINFDKLQIDTNKINGPVKNRIFETLNFKTTSISAEIDENGEFIISTLQDRGNEIFVLKEKNPFNLLKNVSVNIYYLNTYSKAYFAKQTGIRSIDFGSIFLFINGFRIPPYGNYGDDWLGMESRKAQGYSRNLGTREVIGRIEINDYNEDFKIISSRSGIVNNSHFDQLTKSDAPYGFYYKIFRRIERFVVEGIKWDSTPEKDKIIEKNINDPNWTEENEKYTEDSLTRNKRVLSVINKVIDAKKNEIIDLKVNEYFVNSIINEQIECAKKDLEVIIHKASDKVKNMSPDEISDVLNKLSKNSSELKSFSQIVANYSDQTKNETNNLTKIQDSYDRNYMLLKEEKEKLEIILKEKEEARIKEEEERKKTEAEKKRLQEELAIEKEKNTYLLTSKRTMSEDAKGLIHNVKQTSKRSRQNAQSLYDAFIDNTVKKTQALKWLSTIIYNSDKALKISNLITRANFKANSDYQDVNIIKFIEQYLSLYNIMFEDNELRFSIETNVESFWKRISILDISLVIDDLISNSFKANAKTVKIYISENINSELVIIFSDDGDGLSSKFEKNNDVIFDLGVTTTDGSGIGLNYVRKTLSKMQGTIRFIGNNKYLKGASFEVIISKSYK